MKKILYIIPIVVFAMVGLTEDAKAQNGQTGNASNAITQSITNAVIGIALTNTGSNNNNQCAGITSGGFGGTPAQAPQPTQTTTPGQPNAGQGVVALTDSSVDMGFTPVNPCCELTGNTRLFNNTINIRFFASSNDKYFILRLF